MVETREDFGHEDLKSITAHYMTTTGREGQKTFFAPNAVGKYISWARRVEAQGYDIDCIDLERF